MSTIDQLRAQVPPAYHNHPEAFLRENAARLGVTQQAVQLTPGLLHGHDHGKSPTPAKPKGKRLRQDSNLHENHPLGQLPDAQPQPHEAAALDRTAARKDRGVQRARVRFVGYRVRLLDADNFAGSVKDLLDGLRHAALIHDDDLKTIILETEQVRVATFKEEKTVIEIETP